MEMCRLGPSRLDARFANGHGSSPRRECGERPCPQPEAQWLAAAVGSGQTSVKIGPLVTDDGRKPVAHEDPEPFAARVVIAEELLPHARVMRIDGAGGLRKIAGPTLRQLLAEPEAGL